jgi:imidazolonepropionase-like amidohydrolase
MAILVGAATAGSARAQTVAYTGATVWDGTGAPGRAGVTIVVQDGRVTAIGPDIPVPASARVVALDGKYVIPGLVNAHGHVTGRWAPDAGPSEEDRIRGDLGVYARYGVTSVVSLGDGPAAIAIARAPHGSRAHARLVAAGVVVADEDPATARATAVANVDAGASWLKLRVDDNLGTARAMPWPAVEAVFEVGRERDVPVATHLFYLEDARRLLELGTGLLAHSVRDVEIDHAFATEVLEAGVCYVPTLTREVSTFVYGARPDFFDDPFFRRFALADEVRGLEDPASQARFRESRTAAGYRQALPRAESNLRTLHEAGVPIAFGTDSGPAARFPGYFEHLELWMMADAGLDPTDVLLSATSVAARCGRVPDVGILEPGRWADFLVLGEDPTRDIRATRTLERVFVGGVEVPTGDGPS